MTPALTEMGSDESHFNISLIVRDKVTRQFFRDREQLLKRKDSRIRFATVDRAHELCENGGGRPGLPSLISLRFLWT